MTREIRIEPVLNGWICRVGCQTVVFNEKKTMLAEMEAYYSDPDGTEKRYLASALNKVEGPQVPSAADQFNAMTPEARRPVTR